MSEYNINNRLDNCGYAIAPDDVVNGKLGKMIEAGLQVMSLCNDGTGRSLTVAKTLSGLNIPTLHLKGGLKNINRDHNLYAYLLNEINQVPMVAVVLTKEEQNLFRGVLQNLRAYKYISSDSAIESLSRMLL